MKALQRVLILSMFIIPPAAAAQYTIPWASQQPAWVFPLWFEDGSGQKDTIYLGYDKKADKQPEGIDTLFGEKCTLPDSITFTALFTHACLTGYVYKVSVTSETLQLYSGIGFLKSTWPLTMKFDASLFYSDSLPFYADSTGYPDSLPRGYGEISCSNFKNCISNWPSFTIGDDPEQYLYPGCIFPPPFPVPPVGPAPCGATDSIVFYGDSTKPVNFELKLILKPYSPLVLGISEESSPGNFSVSPNPVFDNLLIKTLSSQEIIERIEVYNIVIQSKYVIESVANNEIRIDMSTFEPGFYLVRITGVRSSYTTGIVKF